MRVPSRICLAARLLGVAIIMFGMGIMVIAMRIYHEFFLLYGAEGMTMRHAPTIPDTWNEAGILVLRAGLFLLAVYVGALIIDRGLALYRATRGT